MAEEFFELDTPIEGEDEDRWVAVAMGEEREDGLPVRPVGGGPGEGDAWVGWIRFDAAAGEPSLVTERETTQPNRQDLEYWATGLTYAYLEGALKRARGARGHADPG